MYLSGSETKQRKLFSKYRDLGTKYISPNKCACVHTSTYPCYYQQKVQIIKYKCMQNYGFFHMPGDRYLYIHNF
jgi:hypothetical protein